MKRFLEAKKLTAFVLVVAMLVTAFNVIPAKAAGSYIGKLGLKADAQVGTTYSFKHGYAGIKKAQTMKITVDDLKLLKADKDGYNKLIYTVTFQDMFRPNEAQVSDICDSIQAREYPGSYGAYWTAVVDDNTGLCVEGNKDFDMDVVVVDDNTKCYYDTDGRWITNPTRNTWCVTVVYPDSYDNIVVGFGAQKKIAVSKNNDKFWDSKVAFGKTVYFKKNKKNSKWIKTSDYMVDEKDNGQYDSMSEIVKYDINALKDDLKDIKNYYKNGKLDLESYMFDNGIYSGVYCVSGEDSVNQHSMYGSWDIDVQCVDKGGTTAIYLTRYTNDGEELLYGITAKATDAVEVVMTGYCTSKSLINEKLPLVVAYVLKYPYNDMPDVLSGLGLKQL